jgi:hypothetical protein
MASGFLILPDGRCFARRWSAYDEVLGEIAKSLQEVPGERDLKSWLLLLLPGPEDEEHVGYGPWFRVADQKLVERFIDLRELTENSQQLFMRAAKSAASRPHSDSWLQQSLLDLADMIQRIEQGEPPLTKSDWREVIPSQGRRIGPGWNDQDID